jgi:hypothetical protein
MRACGLPWVVKVLNLGDIRTGYALGARIPLHYNLNCFPMNIPEFVSGDCGAQKRGSLAMSRMQATRKNVVCTR